ncbi:hypothetical protein JCM15908A_00460 [Prevotella dentasini JCM 15908]
MVFRNNRKLCLVLLLPIFSLCLLKVSAQRQYNPSFEELPVWADEFSYTGAPKKSIWGISIDKNGETPRTRYVDKSDNVRVRKGRLELRVKKVGVQQSMYEGGRVYTINARSIKYGKIVIRAKVPACFGSWIALWLRVVDVKGKDVRGEIDVMEYFGSWNRKKFQANVHLWGKLRGNKKHIQNPMFTNQDVSAWHIYTLEWYKDRLVCYMDDVKTYEIAKHDLQEWPFDTDYQLLLAHTYASKNAKNVDDRQLPATLLIDYVRYYRLK